MLQDDWIDELAALHAASGQEIEVTTVTEKIKTLFGHHEASAPRAPCRADEFLPVGDIDHFQIFLWKSDCRRYRSLPVNIPSVRIVP